MKWFKRNMVRIKKILLPGGPACPSDPEDTKENTPLVMWTKGFLAADANLGDEVQVTTACEDRVEPAAGGGRPLLHPIAMVVRARAGADRPQLQSIIAGDK